MLDYTIRLGALSAMLLLLFGLRVRARRRKRKEDDAHAEMRRLYGEEWGEKDRQMLLGELGQRTKEVGASNIDRQRFAVAAIVTFLVFSLHYFSYVYLFSFDEGVGGAPAIVKAGKDVAYGTLLVCCMGLSWRQTNDLRQWIFVPFFAVLVFTSLIHLPQTGLAEPLWENIKNCGLYVLMYWVCFLLDQESRRAIVKWMLVIFVASGVIQVAFSSLFERLGGRLWLDSLYVGFLGNPNNFALILNLATATCLAALVFKAGRFLTVASYASIPIFTCGIVRTASASQFAIHVFLLVYLCSILGIMRDKRAYRVLGAGLFILAAVLFEGGRATDFVLTPIYDAVRAVQGLPPIDRGIEIERKRHGEIAADAIRAESVSVAYRRQNIKTTIGVLQSGVFPALIGDFRNHEYHKMDGQLLVFAANGGLLLLITFGIPAIYVYFSSLLAAIRWPSTETMALHLMIVSFGITLLASRILQYFPLNLIFFLVAGLAVSSMPIAGKNQRCSEHH